MKMNKSGQIDFIDTDVFFEPAYWILTGMAVVGLAIGFGSGGLIGSSEFQVPLLVKAFLLIAVFPIAYLIIKVVNR